MSDPAVALSEVRRPTRSRAAIRQSWLERLARFAQSGRTPAQFCADEGVSLPSFYAWKRRLRAAPLDSAPAAVGDELSGSRLLPVRLPLPDAAVELVLPNGAVLRLAPGCDLAFVRSLLDTLGGTSC